MAPARPDDLHRTLVDRVARRVEGRGVPRTAVDAAVGSVLAALARAEAPSPAPASTAASGGELVAAVTARSLPDLASRLRAALTRAGVAVGPIGIAASGLHHVATLRIPASARPALEAAAATLGASVTMVGGEEPAR